MSLPPLANGKTRTSQSAGNTRDSHAADGQALDNPFRLPSDDQIFRMRDDQRKTREETRDKIKSLKVWERATMGCVSTTQRLMDIIGDEKVLRLKDAALLAQDTTKINIPRRQEKENTTEFVAKKREMFLVQMSLDTKREEIRKLEEKAQMKEEALQRSEQMLEEDAMRFDAFLKENDKKAHDAIKRAEEETKRKQEKSQEIKRLTQQIQALSSEMNKHREALEDCMRYKHFLDMLTPPEWFEQHRKRREDKIREIKQRSYEAKYKDWERMRRRLIENHRKEMEARKEQKKERSKKVAAGRGGVEEEEEDEPETKLSIPPPPRLEDETADVPEEEVPMYFTEPQQLMDIFAALEEQNLFLIQNSQETERTLEELQHAFVETKLSMDAQTGLLQQQIDELQQQITNEDLKVKSLLSKRMTTDGDKPGDHKAAGLGATAGKDKDGKPHGAHGVSSSSSAAAAAASLQSQYEKERLLADLNSKVRHVYETCGFDASSKPSTLFMLSQMESKLEVLLQDIERMPTDHVIKAEKEKEKRRRERKREEQQALQEKLQEERNKRAIERSMQAPKKRLGRQVMYRSRPLRTEEKKLGDDDGDKDNTDEIKFLS